jgi:hypothetical protein
MYTADKNSEHPSDAFLEHFAVLNRIVLNSGSILEGNIYFPDGTHRNEIEVIKNNDVLPVRRHRRANIVSAIKNKNCVLEIGFNAGHSALLMLESNQDIRYIGIDIARHKYTKPCGDYLRSVYGGRFEIFYGSSFVVLPDIAQAGVCTNVDVAHVDGGHSAEAALTDLSNVVRMPRAAGLSRHLIVDDTQMPQILSVLADFQEQGILRSETIGATWLGKHNLFFEIIESGANR